MLSRRRFIAQASLVAGSAVLADSVLGGQGTIGRRAGAAVDVKLLDRAKALLERAPLIDGHNDLAAMFLEVYSDDLSRPRYGEGAAHTLRRHSAAARGASGRAVLVYLGRQFHAEHPQRPCMRLSDSLT